MFKNLTDFSKKRTRKEALGFYIGYVIFVVVGGTLAAALVTLASGSQNQELGFRVGNFVAVATSVGLSFAILSKKKLMNDFALILLALFSGVLAYVGGALLGLIPAAYLSTK